MGASTSYQADVIAWANEQAKFIRAGMFEKLDLENLAEEIEDVGKSETRELASRMAVLLAHLLKWEYQPEKRKTGHSWARTIKDQRERISIRIKKTPSLKSCLKDQDWIGDAWSDAVALAQKETGLDADSFPEECQWAMEQVLTTNWLPS